MSRGLRLKSLAQLTKRPKYGNRKKTLDGIEFDSTREARRYQDLALMQAGGLISELRRQVRFPVSLNNVFICLWLADFTYKDRAGAACVEDSKGFKTPEYRLKKKLVEAQYGISIIES